MRWEVGDHVEYDSLHSARVFRGVIEGFYGRDGVMAMCTDQTGLGSRPVHLNRLRRAATTHWFSSEVA